MICTFQSNNYNNRRMSITVESQLKERKGRTITILWWQMKFSCVSNCNRCTTIVLCSAFTLFNYLYSKPFFPLRYVMLLPDSVIQISPISLFCNRCILYFRTLPYKLDLYCASIWMFLISHFIVILWHGKSLIYTLRAFSKK